MSARVSSEPEENEDSEDEDGDAELGSTGSIDVTNVDIDRDDIRATGHLGKASSVSWAKRTADECRQATDQEPTIGKHERGFALASYHTEDADVEYFDTSKVNAYAWPEHHLADMMVQSYFDYVHNAFPIVDKASFMLKYRHFTRESSNLSADDIIWLGCLNTIFAISAVYSHLTSSDSSPLQGHYNDPLIYCARAKVLCAHDGILEQDARVSTTCALGLLSLYYVSTCRLNREVFGAFSIYCANTTQGLDNLRTCHQTCTSLGITCSQRGRQCFGRGKGASSPTLVVPILSGMPVERAHRASELYF